MNFVPPEELLPNLRGQMINDWQISEDGIHLTLSNGQVLVLIGSPLIAYLAADERAVN